MRLRELLAPTARKHKKAMDPKGIARLLNTSPEALAAFEGAYRTHVPDFADDPAAFGVTPARRRGCARAESRPSRAGTPSTWRRWRT